MSLNQIEAEDDNRVAYFYIDESLIDIEGKTHVIVCAITPNNPAYSALKMVQLKKKLGFEALDEVKMNTSGLPQNLKYKLTDGVLDIILDCTAFITIFEGEDKQKAAEMIAWQMFEYCNQKVFTGYFLYFDKDLVRKPRDFEQFVRNSLKNGAECVGIQHLNSTSEQMIQCCDVFLSLYRLSIEIVFGRKMIVRKFSDDCDDEGYEWILSDYVRSFSRRSFWGITKEEEFELGFNGETITHPFNHSIGLGVRIHSTISGEIKQVIEKELATAYLGCLL